MLKFFNRINDIYGLLKITKKNIFYLITLILISSSLEIIGIGLIIPFINLLLDSSNQYNHLFSAIGLESIDKIKAVLLLSFFLVLVFIIKGIVSIYTHFTIILFSQKQNLFFKKSLLKNYLNLSYQEIININSSHAIQNLLNLSNNFCNGLIISTLKLFTETIILVSIICFLFIINPFEVVSLVFFLVFFIIIYDFFIRKKIIESGRDTNDSSRSIIQTTSESIKSFAEIKTYSKEIYFIKLIEDSVRKYARALVKYQIFLQIPKYLIEFIIVLFMLFVLILNILFDVSQSEIIQKIGVLGFASLKLIPSANMIMSNISQIRYNEDTISKLKKDLNLDIFSSSENESYYDLNELNQIELKDISFSYDNSNHLIKNMNITIKKNDFLAIVGQSGSGKSTLLKIILNFLNPTSGTIILNNKINLKHIGSKKYLQNFAYVPQDFTIIDGSIISNIAFGIPKNQIDIDKVINVSRKSKIFDFISSLQEKFETSIKENGNLLSGGLKQRLAIARALYFDRKFIILDEATSSLDIETENLIINELLELKSELTVVLVTHRIDTIKNFDKIINLDMI